MILQLVVTLAGAIFGLFWDYTQALAALLAGTVSVVPGAFFAWRVNVENSPQALLLQWVGKFAATVMLMALAIIWLQPAALGFFGTFIATQAMYVVGPLKWAKPLKWAQPLIGRTGGRNRQD